MTQSPYLPIVKAQPEQHMVWGWANVATKDGLPVIDQQGDVVDIEDLRKASHAFMEKHRDSGDMHNVLGMGRVVESIVFDNDLQKALGINLGQEGWFIGVKVTNEGVWKRIKSGELRAFSIGGGGRRVELTPAHKVLLGLQKQLTDKLRKVKGNPNHDPHNGQFASGGGDSGRARYQRALAAARLNATPEDVARVRALRTANSGHETVPHETSYDPDSIHGPANHEAANQRALSLPKIADPALHAPDGVLGLAVLHAGARMQTGHPITMPFWHDPTPAPKMGDQYGQTLEPKGYYLHPGPYEFDGGGTPKEYFDLVRQAQANGNIASNSEYGMVEFKNPLVLEFYNTGTSGWKKNLSDMYGGKTGRALSDAIIQSGHDGVLTTEQGGSGFEAVALTANRTLANHINKFNHLHSPTNGQFTTGNGVIAVSTAPPAVQHDIFRVDYSGKRSKYDTKNTIAARVLNSATESTSHINTPERRHLRREIENKMYGNGAAEKQKRIDLVLGMPGAGKSTAIADALLKKHGSLLVDSDDAKRALPEYSDPHYNIPGHVGTIAGALHEESTKITNQVFERAIRNHDNIVLPMIGKDMQSLNSKIDMLKKLGYDVNVHMVDAPLSVTVPRTIKRWEAGHQGYVETTYQDQMGSTPLENFNKIRHDPRLSETTLVSTNVPQGSTPIVVDHWINPSRPTKKSSFIGILGRIDRRNLGQIGKRTGEWYSGFRRSKISYDAYLILSKYNHSHDPHNGEFASGGGDGSETFIPQEAQSSGPHGFVPESAHASHKENISLNKDVERALTDPKTHEDSVSEALRQFYGMKIPVVEKTIGHGVFDGKISPNTIIKLSNKATPEQLDTMAALRGLVTGQEAQVWTKRLGKNDVADKHDGLGYIVHNGTADNIVPLSLKQYEGLQNIIKSDPKFAPLDGSTYKDGSFLFRNFGDTPEPKYAQLLADATKRLDERQGTKSHVSVGRYQGNYIGQDQFLGAIGHHPDALRWAADYLENRTGPAYVKHAEGIGANVGAAKARIARRATDLRQKAYEMDHRKQAALKALRGALAPVRLLTPTA